MSKLIQRLLIESFQSHPDTAAVEAGEQAVTYSCLGQRAVALCKWLKVQGIREGELIGVYTRDKIDLITALTGILWARCVFVPLDQSLPFKRIATMIKNAGIGLVLSDETLETGIPIVRLGETMKGAIPGELPGYLPWEPDDGVYVYFTSGTTGIPRGVLGRNKSLHHLITWEIEMLGVNGKYRVSQMAAVGFDAFLRDWLVPFCCGGTMCVPQEKEILRDSARLVHWLDSRHINLVHCVPAIFRLLISERLTKEHFKGLNYILMAGERLDPFRLKEWYDVFGERIRLVNLYGTTETTMFKSYYFIGSKDIGKREIPAGQPVRGARLVIMDQYLNPCQRGIYGEIFIRTPFAALGYCNEPGLTHERFLPNPMTGDREDIFYRTGDVGRILRNGLLEVKGRADRQMNIRGHRVEPGDIEHCLLSHKRVKEAVVIGVKGESRGTGDEQLTVYIVTRKLNEINQSDFEEMDNPEEDLGKILEQYLWQWLPGYMIPQHFIELERMPLTGNGKVDTSKLPLPASLGMERAGEWIEPGNEKEIKLAGLWAELLGREKESMSRNGNFFNLGGNSLTATIMLSRIHQNFNVKLSLADVFKYQTLEGLARRIDEMTTVGFRGLEWAEDREYYRLSPAQERLFFLERLQGGGTAFNISWVLDIQGEIEEKKLIQAVKRLIERHEMLRTSFFMMEGQPFQRIMRASEVKLEVEEVQGDRSRFFRGFDLSQPPLMRVGIKKIGERSYYLMVDMHHLVCDGTSMGIWLDELLGGYRGDELGVLPYGYKDFVIWQEKMLEGPLIQQQLAYWRGVLSECGDRGVTDIPLDFPRPGVFHFEGDTQVYHVGGQDTKVIRKLMQEYDVTLYMTLLAGWALLLHGYGGGEDIIVGCGLMGRTHADVQGILGMFVNTLPIRNRINPTDPVARWMKQIKKTTIMALENQDIPFEYLVEQLNPRRDPSRHPLFDVTLVVQNFPMPTTDRVPFTVSLERVYKKKVKSDLAIFVSESGDGLELVIEYCTALFKKWTVQRFIRDYLFMLEQMGQKQETTIADLELLREAEKEKVLYIFNKTGVDFPGGKTVVGMFEEQVERTRDCIALEVRENSREILSVTYSELDGRANALAQELIKRGVRPGAIVALRVGRSVEMGVGILGILKTGAAYLPIDMATPLPRVDWILADSAAAFLVTDRNTGVYPGEQEKSMGTLRDGERRRKWNGVTVVQGSGQGSLVNGDSVSGVPGPGPAHFFDRSSLAYIIYTSGSTGRPKGVMVEHGGLYNAIGWSKQEYAFGTDDRVVELFSFGFDAFILVFFAPLVSGSRVVVAGDGDMKDILAIKRLLVLHGITHFTGVPSLYGTLLEVCNQNDLARLRRVTLGGEILRGTLVKKSKEFNDHIEIINEYGPTETTITAAVARNVQRGKKVTIGRPVGNMFIFIMTVRNHPAPIGIGGEIYIGGPGVARGYLNQPELTKERFIIANNAWFEPGRVINNQQGKQARDLNPRLEPGGEIFLFKSGDLGRWCLDGKIEFLGRLDRQVKVNGFRVEPGEIERCMMTVQGVKEAAVVFQNSETEGGGFLLGVIVREEKRGKEIDEKSDKQLVERVKRHLGAVLPFYMVPKQVIVLDEIKRTVSGKIDREALATLEEIGSNQPTNQPLNRLEKQVAGIFSELLKVKTRVEEWGGDDDFFERGGHSLKAMLLVSRIKEKWGVQVPLAEVFRTPTIRGVADFIAGALGEIGGKRKIFMSLEPMEEREYYALSPAQKRIFFLSGLEHIGTTYNMPHIFIVKGKPGKDKLEKAFSLLLVRHHILRTSFYLCDREPVQRVHDHVEFGMETEFCGNDHGHLSLDSKGRDEYLLQCTRNFVRPFDLAVPPLLRVGLLRVSENEYLFLFDMHHIVGDGTSMGILVDDVSGFYEGEGLALAGLEIQYHDYAVWLNGMIKNGEVSLQERYWLERFAELETMGVLELPLDFPRPEVFDFCGDVCHFVLSSERAGRLKQLGQETGATLFMIVLGVFYGLLYRYTGQEDMVVGSGTMGRRDKALEGLVGMFINTLALRGFPSGQKTFSEFLDEVKTTVLEALENQDFPFEDLVERLELKRDPSRNPLFDVMLVVQNVERAKKSLKDLVLEPYHYQSKTSKFDLGIYVIEMDEEIHFRWEYSTALFKRETVQRMGGHFLNIIDQVTRDRDEQLGDIEYLSGEEKRLLLEEFSNTRGNEWVKQTLHELFEERVEAFPDRVAVVGNSLKAGRSEELISNRGDNILYHLNKTMNKTLNKTTLSYKELDRGANPVAHFLHGISRGEKPGGGAEGAGLNIVGVWLEGVVEQVTAILGVLKAGAAYLPIDAALPYERVRWMIDDAGVRVMISQEKYRAKLERLQWECLGLDVLLIMDGGVEKGGKTWTESELKGLMDEKLWDYVGETAVDDITGGGWINSYTGLPFSGLEMEEYAANTRGKLEQLMHGDMKVLEVGCATGLTMFTIAPLVREYWGIDISKGILARNQEKIKREGHINIHLAHLAGHEVDQLGENHFDLVIINSVIQCFPGYGYLREVIRNVINVMGERGHLFIGDIMDLDKKRALVKDLENFKAKNKISHPPGAIKPGNGIEREYITKTDWSAELFVARGFWEELIIDFPCINGAWTSEKKGTVENELTRFRYDVLLSIDQRGKGEKKKRNKRKWVYNGNDLSQWNPVKGGKEIDAGTAAYVIYTSGSTGFPKATVISHWNVAGLVAGERHDTSLNREDRCLQAGNFAFDAAVFNIFAPLVAGGVLVMAGEEEARDVEQLAKRIKQESITSCLLVTAVFNTLVDSWPGELGGMRKIMFGGEVASTIHVKKALDLYGKHRLVNLYGPTEATVFCLSYAIDDIKGYFNIPVGRPLQDIQVFIVDKHFNVVPIGVGGEIIIGGRGVGEGYLNQPERTREKFFYQSAYQYVYQSGDMGRWLHDGNMEFLGRRDCQVKIRGYRVEPGEIENNLKRIEGIGEAVVLAWGDENSDNNSFNSLNSMRNKMEGGFLCGYVVNNNKSKRLDGESIKKELEQRLPAYMIPVYILVLDDIPLTGNGKVDRKKLGRPGMNGKGADRERRKGVLPENYIQKTMATIWADILGLEKQDLDIDDHFFKLGGHSLKATVMISKVQQELGVRIPLGEVFKKPTIKALSEFIEEKRRSINLGEDVEYSVILPVERQEYYPVTAAQRRLYFLQQLEKRNVGYNETIAAWLEGNIDGLEPGRVLEALVARHESLRTTFHLVGDEPVQQVHDTGRIILEKPGCTVEPVEIIREFVRPFNLEECPLFRVILVSLSQEKHLLVMDAHHIIIDGTSLGIFVREFMCLAGGEKLAERVLHYKDFAVWEVQRYGQQEKLQQENFWLKKFQGELPVLTLPLDYPRPVVQRFEGRRVNIELPGTLTNQLKAFALGEDMTVFMVVLGVYNILLWRLTGQEDIVIGTAIAGRRHADLQSMVGMFVNTLALRNKPSGNRTPRDFFKEIKEDTLESFENQEYPFEELVERLEVRRDISQNPLFTVALGFHNLALDTAGSVPVIKGPGIMLTPFDYDERPSKFDLTLHVHEADGIMVLTVEYCIWLLKETTIRRWVRYFKRILWEVMENPDQLISRIEILSESEKQALVVSFNDTAMIYGEGGRDSKRLEEFFADQVERGRDRVAVTSWGEGNAAISYGKLKERGDELAWELKKLGARPGMIVAIMMNRSLEMVVGILGILGTGGIYLPVDPGYPGERIKYIINDSAAGFLLEKGNVTDGEGESGDSRIKIGYLNEMQDLSDLSSSGIEQENEGHEWGSMPAYVVYTSGSTGWPKGVLVGHQGVVNMVLYHRQLFGEDETSRFSTVASVGFDAVMFEMWPCILSGGVLVLAPVDVCLSPQAMLVWLRQQQITISFQTTVMVQQLLDLEWPTTGMAIKILCTAGDRLTRYPCRHLDFRFYNLYGVTEDTVWATWYRVRFQMGFQVKPPPIGKPVGNKQIYILDRALMLQPVGVGGELYIGGDGIALGYLNKPGLTNERFICCQRFGFMLERAVHSRYLYKTGDWGCWLEDGNIEFLGRMDEQLKIRGFRIEIGEIESRLLQYEGVKAAVVVQRKNSDGEGILCAYVVGDGNPRELKTYLKEYLPGFMVPAYIVMIERLPLTGNNKIDVGALPGPMTGEREYRGDHIDYMAPRSVVELKLVETWHKVLKIAKEKISIDGNFFDLGGHSLKATVLVSMIHRDLGVALPLSGIFKHPTVRDMAEWISSLPQTKFTGLEKTEDREYYPLTPGQKRFYVLQQLEPGSMAFHMPLLVPLKGNEGDEPAININKIEHVLNSIISRHESLRTSFHVIDGQLVQRVHDRVEFFIESKDTFSSSPLSLLHPYDLSKPPLLRAVIIKPNKSFCGGPGGGFLEKNPLVAEGVSLLLIDIHHIIADGFSIQVLTRDFNLLMGGKSLQPLRFQFRDFSGWLNSRLESEKMKGHEEYWLKQLGGRLPVLNLPVDFARPLNRVMDGARYTIHAGRELMVSIKELIRGTGTTLYMVLLGVYSLLLSRYSGQDDIIIGSPIAGRFHVDLEQVIGLVMGSVMMRSCPGKNKTFAAFLEEIKTITLEAYEHQQYPFEELLKILDWEEVKGHDPVSDVGLIVQNIFEGPVKSVKIEERLNQHIKGTAKLDLTLDAVELDNDLLFTWEYSTALFKGETIERMGRHWLNLLSHAVREPWAFLGDMNITGEISLLPLSHPQQRIYDMEMVFQGSGCNTLAFTVRYGDEKLDWHLLEVAINRVIAGNEALRLGLVEQEFQGGPRQYIANFKPYTPEKVEFKDNDDIEKRLGKWIERDVKDVKKGFNVIKKDGDINGSKRLFDIVFLDMGKRGSGYYLKYHHLVGDGWSFFLLVKEIDAIYRVLQDGKVYEGERKVPYQEFICYERDYLRSQAALADRVFWLNCLVPLPEPVELWTPFAINGDESANRVRQDETRSKVLKIRLGEEMRDEVLEFCKNKKTTLYKLVLTVLAIFIERVTGSRDFVIGGAGHNRGNDLLRHLVGMCAGTFVFRVKLNERDGFWDTLNRLGRELDMVVKERQRYPYNWLLDDLRKETGKDPGYLLNINLIGHGEWSDERIAVEHHFTGHESSPLVIHINQHTGNRKRSGFLELEWIYRESLFTGNQVQQMHGCLEKLLGQVLKEPWRILSDLELVTVEEKNRLLYIYNQPVDEWNEEWFQGVHEQFEDQVKRSPDHVALVGRVGFGKENNIKGMGALTYGELNGLADEFAGELKQGGVGQGDIVAIMSESALVNVIGLLAILKTGAAYLPIEWGNPEERTAYILKDSCAALLIIENKIGTGGEYIPQSCRKMVSHSSVFSVGTISWLCIFLNFIPMNEAGWKKPSPVVGRVFPASLAYIIYTSGTTGKPKGVMVEHGNLSAYVEAFQTEFKISPRDIVLQQASFSFDAFAEELYPALVYGGKVVVAEREETRDTGRLYPFISSQCITVVSISPYLMSQLEQFPALASVRLYISGGDVLRGSECSSRVKQTVVYNTYGPTETTVCATYYRCQEGNLDRVPVGKPILNYNVYIIDRNEKLLPTGIGGEIIISGKGVARGYLNEPGRTAAKFPFLKKDFAGVQGAVFLKEPPGCQGHQRAFKSGDLGRWLDNGNIEFLGRIDEQIKIRGFRIEPGEIENRLLGYEWIGEAAVIKHQGDKGYDELVAFVVAKKVAGDKTAPLTREGVCEFLGKGLPSFMVPSAIHVLERIPRTYSGKVDRQALLKMKMLGLKRGNKIEEPVSTMEKQLLRLWQEVLGVENISVLDHFFQVGGHSLKALALASRIHKTLGRDTRLSLLYRHPILRDMANMLEKERQQDYSSIEKAPLQKFYPLSPAQKRLFILEQMGETGTAYHITRAIIIEGELDIKKLQKVFATLIQRHESLRTSFHLVNGEPVQEIHDEVEFKVHDDGDNLEFNRVTFYKLPFHLSHAPLCRVGLVKGKRGEFILIVDLHHIIADGWSINILVREFITLYRGNGELTLLPLQYKDYAWWQVGKRRAWIKKQEQFWLDIFPGEPPVLQLPYDFIRPVVRGYEGSRVESWLSARETQQLIVLAREQGVTLFMLFLGIFGILLSRLSGQEDIVIGTPTAGRRDPDLEGVVGMFVNTLPLRLDITGKNSFIDLLEIIKNKTLQVFENQEYPFEELVAQLALPRDTGRHPLFDVMFSFQETTRLNGDWGLKAQLLELETTVAKFDLTLEVQVPGLAAGQSSKVIMSDDIAQDTGSETRRQNETIGFSLEYSTKLFKKETGERFACYFRTIVATIGKNGQAIIGEIDILTHEERQRLMFAFNETRTDFPGDKTLYDLFVENAGQYPGRMAIVSGIKEKDKPVDELFLTYGELKQRTDRLAGELVMDGVQPGDIVAIEAVRRVETIIGILAILKTGAAYLPVDPGYPGERTRYILEDSGAAIFLKGDQNKTTVSWHKSVAQQPDRVEREQTSSPGGIAYIIYTSGTTGKPRGVVVEHRSVVNVVTWFSRSYSVGPGKHVLQMSDYTFDASVNQVFGSLLHGAVLYLVTRESLLDIYGLREYMASRDIYLVNFVPLFLKELLLGVPKISGLEVVISGADRLDWQTRDGLIAKGYRLYNHYGPTETTIDALAACCQPGEPVYLGKPIANVNVNIFSADRQLVPVGVVGELYITGMGLARGYLNNPGLTAERFVWFYKNKNHILPGPTLFYKTGDLGRWTIDGNIEFMGRSDMQIKVRGYRVEPGEIERQMAGFPGIDEAIVVGREKQGSGMVLLGYYTSRNHVSGEELKKYLTTVLPFYMVPMHYISLEKVPLTKTGKIDYARLPFPCLPISSRLAVPVSDSEKQLVSIWREVLHNKEIGVETNFFDFGGHSIEMIKVAERLKEKYHMDVPVMWMFQYPTIRDLCAFLDQKKETVISERKTEKKLGKERLNRLRIKKGRG